MAIAIVSFSFNLNSLSRPSPEEWLKFAKALRNKVRNRRCWKYFRISRNTQRFRMTCWVISAKLSHIKLGIGYVCYRLYCTALDSIFRCGFVWNKSRVFSRVLNRRKSSDPKWCRIRIQGLFVSRNLCWQYQWTAQTDLWARAPEFLDALVSPTQISRK